MAVCTLTTPTALDATNSVGVRTVKYATFIITYMATVSTRAITKHRGKSLKKEEENYKEIIKSTEDTRLDSIPARPDRQDQADRPD